MECKCKGVRLNDSCHIRSKCISAVARELKFEFYAAVSNFAKV